MGLTSQQYAHLADHSYDRGGQMRDLVNKKVVIGGDRYRVIDYVDNPGTGYQGTVYQHEGSGAIVVAHRGTEFGREAFRDGLIADGGMAFSRTNSQASDAVELTRRAVEYAERQGRESGRTAPEVTVTGHSLGGTLAQVSAHHFGLRGQTFNAYGAASLDRRIPEGGDRVINHVMAADAVSSASPHYGQVRVYAMQREVDTLHRTGYHDDVVRDLLQRDMPLTASVMSAGSHSMHNFLPEDGDGRPDRSVLEDPQARRRADEHHRMIGEYREDVGELRRGVTVVSRGPFGMVLDGIDHIRGPLPAGEPAAREQREQREQSQAVPRSSESFRAIGSEYYDGGKFIGGGQVDAGGAVRPPLRPGVELPSLEVDRLLTAARANDPAALRAAQDDLQASAFGQSWRALVQERQRDLAQQAAGSDIVPRSEPRMSPTMEMAR